MYASESKLSKEFKSGIEILLSQVLFKEALNNFSLIPNFFFQKSWDFYTIRRICYVINACVFLLATLIRLQRYKDFSFVGHFKKSTSTNTNRVVYGTL